MDIADSRCFRHRAAARRAFLGRSLAVGAACLPGGTLLSLAAQTSEGEVHDFRADVRVNGEPVDRRAVIRAGDTVTTGANGYIVFALGQDAFMVRSRSEMRLERPSAGSVLVSGLRLVTGAVGAVFGKGPPRTLSTVTVTAGIRGTGVYLETRAEGVYFCTCYGEVELTAVRDEAEREVCTATQHEPRIIRYEPREGRRIEPASWETHTDAEMDMLEKCVGRRAPWVR